MADKILGPQGSKRRRRFLWVPLLAVFVLALLTIGGAQAWNSSSQGVENTGLFALDGNTFPTSCATENDWAGLVAAGGLTPCGADGFSFISDGVGAADHTYWQGGGSKDQYDPAVGPWLWGPNNVSPDKNDLDNAFAAIYHLTDQNADPTKNLGSVPFLFFGSDRYDTSGDAQQGFQFLQAATCLAGPVGTVSAGGNAACPTSTPNQAANAGKFVDPNTGLPVHHMNGDLLVLVNFNKGGTLGSAGVFVWGGATAANPGGGSYSQVSFGSGTNAADCTTITGQSNFCATSNVNPLAEPTWAYTAKGTTGQATYAPGAFIEGGVNLKAIPGGGSCFPSFLAETRSSAGPGTGLGLSAQLKDLAFGKFELCNSGTVTTPEDATGTAITAPISIGGGKVQVEDLASVTGNGSSAAPTGNVKFWLCGPAATDAAAQCDSTAAGPTNGAAVTPDKALTVPSTGTTSTATSALATVTSAGHYCWRADYQGDSNYPKSIDRSLTECFTVSPVTPGIATHQSASTGVTLGTAITDTADISGTPTNPTNPAINLTNTSGTAASGTVTFKLYGPRDDPATAVCSDAKLVYTSSPADSVTGNQTGVGSASFTPTTAGTYDWVATYNSSSANMTGLPISSNCGDEPSILISLQPTMSTAQHYVLHDDATVNLATSGAGDLKGYVRFRLYNNASCDTTAPNALLYDSNTQHASGIAVDATGQTFPQSVTVHSDNVSVDATASHLSWLVTFTSTQNGIKNVTETCDTQNSSVTITNGGTANTP